MNRKRVLRRIKRLKKSICPMCRGYVRDDAREIALMLKKEIAEAQGD
ncbi:MAG: hypothetical protein ACTTI3_08000 [Treponema sp.]